MSQTPDQMPDRWILGAYRQLHSMSPPTRLDKPILDAAGDACGRTANTGRRSWWIWPVSMAAGMVLTIGIFFQIDQLLPRPTVVVLDAPTAAKVRPAQRVGSSTPAGNLAQPEHVDNATLDRPGPAAGAPRTGVRIRDLSAALETAARNGEVDQARALLERMDDQATTLRISEEARAWLIGSGLGELLPSE